MKNTQLPNFEVLQELYSHYTPENIPVELQKLKQYLLNGYNWYSKNIQNGHEHEHKDNLSFLEEVKDLMEKMMILSGTHICYVDEGNNSKVNLTPFIDYLRDKKIKIIIAQLKDVQRRCHDYLNDCNILEFKACSKFIDELDFLFTWIYRD